MPSQNGVPSLSGAKERVWCDNSWNDDGHNDNGGSEKTLSPTVSPNSWADDGHKDFCLTKDDCNAARKKAGYANNHFHSGTYRDHGCFTKNGKVFFGIGGTKKQMKITDLGGVKERFYCGGGGWEGDAHKPTDKPSKEPSKEPSKCLAHAACHISTFRSVQLQLTLFRYFSSHTHKMLY